MVWQTKLLEVGAGGCDQADTRRMTLCLLFSIQWKIGRRSLSG
jgi:hypothetical protein